MHASPSPRLSRVFTIRAAITLPHPPDAVFAALANVESAVRWQAGVRGVGRAPRARGAGGPASGASRTGDALVLHYRALGVRHALRTRVTAHERPARFAYRAEGTALVFDAAFTIDAGRDGSRVTWTLTLHGAGPAADAAGAGCAAETAPDLEIAYLRRLRRLLARRLPRDLARLEPWVAVQPGAVATAAQGGACGALPSVGLEP
jgi:uncharacterized protein YndB with AHSA1/START domain